MCKLVEAIVEGSEKSDEELNEEIEWSRKQMDCKSGHCAGCPYNYY